MIRFSKLAGAIAAAAAALTLSACGYNAIPTQKQAVDRAWGDVQGQYQRRADLIPNLVNTVQGYAAQEASVLTAVTQARASATQVHVDASSVTDPAAFQRFAAAQDQLSGVLGRLMAISENYPTLQSNQNFLALQNELEGTENRISVARRDYNEAAQRYNTTLVTFPAILWAKTAHSSYKKAEYFAASQASQNAPTVSFPAPNVGGALAPAK